MTRREDAATIIAESMCNKPKCVDLPTHVANMLDRAGMFDPPVNRKSPYTVVDGRRGPKIVYNAA